MEIVAVPVLRDNYAYLLRDTPSHTTAVVDPSEAGPILAALRERGWRLHYVLNTHHHSDHVGGNLDLKRQTGARIAGHAGDAARIPGIDVKLAPGSELTLGSESARVISAGGHTRGHVLYHFERVEALFSGDTLFSMGCGRLFEGTPEEMWGTLDRIRRLPRRTRIYFGHEYTQRNAEFALSVEPGNERLRRRKEEVDRLRSAGAPTVPVTLEEELATNPFLRPDSAEIRERLGLESASDAEVFGRLREMKDEF